MILNLGKKIIELDDWDNVPNHRNRIRKIFKPPLEGLACGPLLMVSWSGEDTSSHNFHWHVEFLGPELSFMNKLYKQCSHPVFRDHEYLKAQEYVDKFMIRVSKLLLFS